MFKYETVAEDIEKRIHSGQYGPGSRLPQEMELCTLYECSRITVREAMDLLVNKGLIIKRRGAGTFVKAVTGDLDDQEAFSKSHQFSGFTKDMGGKHVSSQIHEFKLVPAPELIAEKLKVAPRAFVCYLCRTRLVDGEPYVTEYTYMPTDFITGITEEVVNNSIYQHIEHTLNLKIKGAHRIVRASMPTEEERKWLSIGDAGLPILEVEQVGYLDDGRIFEYSKARHRADRFELRTISVRP